MKHGIMTSEVSERRLKAITLRVVQVAFHNNRGSRQCWSFLLNRRARAEMNNQVVGSNWTQAVLASPESGREARILLANQIKESLKWRVLVLGAGNCNALVWSRLDPTSWRDIQGTFLFSALCLVLTFVITHFIDIRLVRQWDSAWQEFQANGIPIPPVGAEFLLWLLLPREGREAAIGDNNEQFEILAAKFGPRRARFWYWSEVARAVWPILA